MPDENPVTAAGETVAEVVETATEAVQALEKEATETATGVTEVPAEVVDKVVYATQTALDAATGRIEELERKIGQGVVAATEVPEKVVETVAEPPAVENVAGKHRRPKWLDAIH